MTDSVVAEGQARLRDGKKWKNRWLVLRKPSPVADCLLMLVFKDKCEKSKGHKERSSLTLEDICGLEPGLSLEGVSHILAIICLGQTVLLAFENKETMCAWDIRTRYSLGEVHRFHVTVLPGTKLESGPATLHFCNNIFVLVRDVPPCIIGHWKLSDMRRYGAIPNGFVFEGGSRCGPWAGVFFLSCAEGERISFLFDCIVRGISPTKGPFGIRPVLPDTSISTTTIEERISHEALELEKRLSLLSQSSRHSSGGDDRSLSSSTESSDTSQSDTASVGSRLTLWAEQQPAAPGPGGGSGSGPGPGPQEAGRRPGPEASGSARPHAPAKPPRCRRLQEVGRQGSSDSGIATASHSSSSGSFSSCAGSDEFGSQASLMPAARTAPTARAWCNCGSGLDYRVPAALQYHHYDSPRSILQPPGPRGEEEEAVGACDSCGPAPTTAPAPPLIATCLSCGGLKGTTASQLGPSPTLGAPGSGVEVGGKAGRFDLYALLRSQIVQRKEQRRVAGQTKVKHSGSWQSVFGDRYGTLWDFRSGRLNEHRVTRDKQEDSAAGGYALRRSCSVEGGSAAAVPRGQCAKAPGGGGNGAAPPLRHSGNPQYQAMAAADHSQPGQGDRTGQSQGYRPLSDVWGELERGRDGRQVVSVPGRLLAAMTKVRTFPGTREPAARRAVALHPAAEPYLLLQAPGDPHICQPAPQRREPQVEEARGHGVPGKHGEEWSRPRLYLPNPRTATQEHAEYSTASRKPGLAQHSHLIEDKKTGKKEEKPKVVTGQMYELMESLPTEKQSEAEKCGGYEYMASCGQQKPLLEAEGPPGASKSHRGQGSHPEMLGPKQKREKGFPDDETSGSFDTKKLSVGTLICPQDLAGADRPRGEGPTYINIPVSPVSKKQLHYMELELQESSPAIRGASSSKYAQIDITATETAHKVGSQHAQHREERLQELEQKRKGPPLQ
ncbi:protein Dok-7 isoform X2 [Amblyraja radiata]|uniref:protein Dok-7 isoform X2 n=1 Tax=Amblyraja radiata TaxID=386614 RepID=UPI001401C2D2|nr:protein Dok-7 isoform X2 [Amblyraja radiata]